MIMNTLYTVKILVLVSSFIKVIAEESYEDTKINDNMDEQYDDKEYEEYYTNQENLTEKYENLGGEHNMVLGHPISEKEVPFIAVTDINTICTGSLISPKWIVTAAHCSEIIANNDIHEVNKCIYYSQRRRPYTYISKYGKRESCQCRLLHDESIEYSGFSEPYTIQLGLKNIDILENWSNVYPVKRILRHSNTYKGRLGKPNRPGLNRRGGGFRQNRYRGRDRGHDVSLIEIERETERQFACLPSPNFNDIVVSKAAGYGRYHRKHNFTDIDVCQTDESGQMRFHYCMKKGHGTDVCQKTSPPQSINCNHLPSFLKFETYIDPVTKKEHKKEMIFFEQQGNKLKLLFSCFDIKTHHEHGWCYTEDNYYDAINTIHSNANFNPHWGYCSDECFQSHHIPLSGILRVKENLDVLDERFCNNYLRLRTNIINQNILCVGYKKKIEADLYLIKSNSDIKKLSSKSLLYHHYADHFGGGFYVTAAGVCSGDSGGPLYVQKTKRGMSHYIVTGVVSGGTGNPGNCGGVNNPTQYVRLKKFTKWIERHVEETCKA